MAQSMLMCGFGVPAIVVALAGAQPVSESIGGSMVRFHASAEARENALPSMALVEARPATGEAPGGFPVDVEFGRDGDRWTASVALEDGTSLYGTGEVAGPLMRNGRVVETWNTDAYGYQEDTAGVYTSHPWVLAVRKDGTAFGVLADTTYRCEIDLKDGIVFRAVGPEQPVIVIDGRSPQEVCERLGELTGTITMPPKWAIGYHQCRYSYDPADRVRELCRMRD